MWFAGDDGGQIWSATAAMSVMMGYNSVGLTCRVLVLLSVMAVWSVVCGRSAQATIDSAQAFTDPVLVSLAVASARDDIAGIDLALEKGAKINAVGRDGVTVLWIAVLENRRRAFAHLLAKGADPNVPDKTGEPLLGWVISRRDRSYLEQALANGGNPNAVNAKSGKPIIFRAVSDDTGVALDLLIAAGADLNARDGDGATPIVYASQARLIHAVVHLLGKGADPYLRDEFGSDVASGLFAPNWPKSGSGFDARQKVIGWFEAKGEVFKWSLIEKARIRNMAEATGRESVMWLSRNDREPNPEWVRSNPDVAERWYMRVLGRSAPK